MPSLLSRASGYVRGLFSRASSFFSPPKPAPKRRPKPKEELVEYSGAIYFAYDEKDKKHRGRLNQVEVKFKATRSPDMTVKEALDSIREEGLEWLRKQPRYEWFPDPKTEKINVGAKERVSADRSVKEYEVVKIKRGAPKDIRA